MASCTEDSIVVHVLPFVKEHLRNANWQYRDAAIMSLGAIMEGPDPATMATVIIEAGVSAPSPSYIMVSLWRPTGDREDDRVDEPG